LLVLILTLVYKYLDT